MTIPSIGSYSGDYNIYGIRFDPGPFGTHRLPAMEAEVADRQARAKKVESSVAQAGRLGNQPA
jgi:hypothetical protein